MKKNQLILWLLILLLLSLVGYVAFQALRPNPPTWTGFGESTKKDDIVAAKTLWDWLDLLIIPAVIAIIGWSYNKADKTKTRRSEEEKAQNETLNLFIQKLTILVTEKNLLNDTSGQIKAIARTTINLSFNCLNGERKGQALQFLYESNLIDNQPIINLVGSNLRNIVLDEIVLSKSEIRGAYFNNASLLDTNLNEANLIGCDFTKANLSGSLTRNLDLSYSDLTEAKLMNMDLTTVNFEGVTLTKANLKGSKITKCQLDSVFRKEKIKTKKTEVI